MKTGVPYGTTHILGFTPKRALWVYCVHVGEVRHLYTRRDKALEFSVRFLYSVTKGKNLGHYFLEDPSLRKSIRRPVFYYVMSRDSSYEGKQPLRNNNNNKKKYS